MVQVHRLVERFDQKGNFEKSDCIKCPSSPNLKTAENSERKFIIDCEQDIRGIVKKVVKVSFFLN